MSLSFSVALLVRHHSNGSVTAEVVGERSLCAWGLDLPALQEDLELALIDRIERSHPSLLARFHAPRGQERIGVLVDGLLELLGDPVVSRPSEVDVLLEPEGTWRRLWIPALDARLWIDPDEDLEAAVRAFVDRSMDGKSIGARLAMRPEGGMSLVTLQLEVAVAPLQAFTGEEAGAMLLPAPKPKEELDEEKAEEKKVPTPTLDGLAIETTAEPELLVKAHGRQAEVADLVRMLDKPGAAVVIVGPPTCGKSAVIDGVGRALAAAEKRAFFVDASRLVNADGAGWRQQAISVMQELGEVEGIWLCGDPISLLDAGKYVGSEMNVSQVMKPFLSGGQLRVLGECSESTWGKLEAKDAGFARMFTPYRMTEPAGDATRAVLTALSQDLVVKVNEEGLTAAMELSRRYGPPDALLGTTCHFLRRLSAEAKARGVGGPLGRLDVLTRFSAETGLPEILLRDELTLDPDAVRDQFRERLVGQDDALGSMVDLIAVIKGGMSDLGRPLGSFLFVGPTGVGKTETAKALASWLFGRSDKLVRFDMSEFSGPDCLSRLLDAEAGLVARVRQTPFCVVLLDEIEKAHDAVFDLLLQVLGEARLSDGTGRTADFRNAVVLMTSNLGVGSFRRPTGFGGDEAEALQDHVLSEVERFFRPELFNRIDRVVPFASLGADAILGIAERELAAVARREGISGQGIALELAPEVPGFLAARGVDLRFGARPLKRAIQTWLISPLARHLSSGGVPPRVRVEVEGDALGFHNQDTAEKSQTTDKLEALLRSLSELRYRAECWWAADLSRSARHEVRLVDRLMASKRFWSEHAAATARSRAIEPVRNAGQALQDAKGQVYAIEELAHEAWLDRDAGAVEALQEQLREVNAALSLAELGMLGARFDRPEVGWLHLEAGEGALVFGRRLVATYAQIAVDRGWEMKISSSGTELKWPKEDLTLDGLLHRVRKLSPGPYALRFEGLHAAPLLSTETGVHLLKDGQGGGLVTVRFGTKRLGKDKETLRRQVRWYDTRKGHIRHPQHKAQKTLHTQWDQAVVEMMRHGLYLRALGEDLGPTLWRNTSWS